MEQALQEFLKFEYADEVMIALGAFLVFTAVIRILKSSLTLIIWVALAGVGVASVSYGMNRSAIDLPFIDQTRGRLTDLAGSGTGLSADTLAVLCARLGLD